MLNENEEPRSLYKRVYEYQDIENNELIKGIDWVSMTQAEADLLIFEYINTGTMNASDGYSGDSDYALVKEELEKATEHEEEAYKEGYIEGNSVGIAEERWANYNGVGFRIDTDFAKNADADSFMKSFHKMFQCGRCEESFSFEEAATIGPYYITMERTKEEHKVSVLWYICKGCSLG